MDDLLDMIQTDESPSQVSDKIKELLFAKSAEKIDGYRSSVASSLFNEPEETVEDEEEEITPDEE
jgi:hypothetical protein|tara:strand:- start:774 stop:968 length:195 start_codon:yes stop_codon:yes gene_type:complete